MPGEIKKMPRLRHLLTHRHRRLSRPGDTRPAADGSPDLEIVAHRHGESAVARLGTELMEDIRVTIVVHKAKQIICPDGAACHAF